MATVVCPIAGRHLLYVGATRPRAPGRASTPNVVCDGRRARPRCHGDGCRSKGRRSDDRHRAGRGTTHAAAAAERRPSDGDGGVRLLCDALRPEHKDLITVQLTSDRTDQASTAGDVHVK